MLSEDQKARIKAAWLAGELRVAAVDPQDGRVGLYTIKDVMQHHTGDRLSVEVMTAARQHVRTTADHSLFQPAPGHENGILPIRSDALAAGDEVSQVAPETRSTAGRVLLTEVRLMAPLPISYDLCVPGPENFVLSNGLVAHNSYSIGGISLDIDKSSKYMDLKRNAEEQWDKLTEAKQRTEKYTIGLKQPRYGIGIKSAFGPALGRGTLSPRSYVS